MHAVHKALPYPHAPIFDLASDQAARLILYRKCDGLELWRLGSAVDEAVASGDVFPVNTPPVKLLDMELTKVLPPPSLPQNECTNNDTRIATTFEQARYRQMENTSLVPVCTP